MRGRQIAIVALLAVGSLLAVGACLGVWANRQALDTDEWVDTSTRLLEDEPIRTAIGFYLVDRLYDSDKVEERLEGVLPPRLDPLAGPAAAALKQAAQRNVPRLLGNAVALDAWRDANRAAHERLLQVLDGDGEGVSLDLSSLLTQVADDAGLPESAVSKLPPNLGQLEVLPRGARDRTRDRGCSAHARLAARGSLHRRLRGRGRAVPRPPADAASRPAPGLMLAGVAALALRRVGGNVVVDALAQSPNGEAAARDAWSIATSLLVDGALGTILLGLIVMSGAWLGGPGRLAAWLRRAGAPALRDNPNVARVALALLLLLLVLWAPVHRTGRVVPMLALTAAAFAWLEWLRRRAVEESPPSTV